MTNNQPPYTVDLSTTPPSCLPTALVGSNLRDVTRLGDPWRRYIDVDTGQLHDGAKYAAEAQRLASGTKP